MVHQQWIIVIVGSRKSAPSRLPRTSRTPQGRRPGELNRAMLHAAAALTVLALGQASAMGQPGTAAATAEAAPAGIFFFDMDKAVIAESLDYEEQLVAFVFEGLVNEKNLSAPTVMLKAGYMNFDWPGSDEYWNGWLTEQKRATFTNVSSSTLCGLVTGADPHKRIKGTVLYETAGEKQEEWSVPIAKTVATQQALLPVTAAIRAKHPCLNSLPVVTDLTKNAAMATADTAWEWAFKVLLPQSSKTIAFNLYHYNPAIHTDPQSNATLANVDWAVQQNAFIMNFHTPDQSGSDSCENCAVNPLFSEALASMEPLFSMYGWSDNEFGLVWSTETSGASADGTKNNSAAGGGGAVFCSFATPNLSFWKLLGLPNGQTKARPLPVYDIGR